MALYNPTLQPSTLYRTPAAQQPPKARILFVHGAWHGAWFWERWQRLYANYGYETYALDLPGHGSRATDGWVWRAGINDYVQCVRTAVEEIGTCILVGHSMGGFTVMKYLERYDDCPAAVLLAPVPHTGFPMGNLFKLTRAQPSSLVALLLSMPLKITSERLVRTAFFSEDIDEATVRRTMAQLCPETAHAEMDLMLKRVKPAKISTKTLVVHAANDWLISGDKMRALAQALPAGEYLELPNAAHDAALDTRWEEHGRSVWAWLDKVDARTAPPTLGPPPNWKHAAVKHLVPPPPPDLTPSLPTVPGESRRLIHRPERTD